MDTSAPHEYLLNIKSHLKLDVRSLQNYNYIQGLVDMGVLGSCYKFPISMAYHHLYQF